MITGLVTGAVICFALYIAMGVITITTLADSVEEDAAWRDFVVILFIWPAIFFGE